MRISDWSSGVCSSDLHAPQWLRDTPSPLVTPQTMAEPYRTVDIPAFVERWLGRVPPEARATLEQWRETLEHALAESAPILVPNGSRSEEHTSELQSLMRISYAVFCLKKKHKQTEQDTQENKHAQTDG